MFALKPWTKRTSALLPRMETPFGVLAEEFAPIFERFFAGWPVMETPEPLYRYPLTLETKENEVVVRVELPGFAPEEVKVEMKGEALFIEAEHKAPVEKAGEKEGEGAYAHVKKEIELPLGVEAEKAEATYRHGILEVHLPKKPEVVGRRIEVKI